MVRWSKRRKDAKSMGGVDETEPRPETASESIATKSQDIARGSTQKQLVQSEPAALKQSSKRKLSNASEQDTGLGPLNEQDVGRACFTWSCFESPVWNTSFETTSISIRISLETCDPISHVRGVVTLDAFS